MKYFQRNFNFLKRNSLIPSRDFSTFVEYEEKSKLAIWGRGDRGQLGLGKDIYLMKTPKLLPVPKELEEDNAKFWKVGCNHSLLVSQSNEIYSFGIGEFGQLGHGRLEDEFTPKKIESSFLNGKNIYKVACGGHHSLCAIRDKKENSFQLLVWGRNKHGQLGLGNEGTEYISYPKELNYFRNQEITILEAGDEFSIVGTSKGLYSFGRADVGQFPFSNIDNQQGDYFSPVLLKLDEQIEQVSCGWGHVLAIDSKKRVWTWGSNLHGQCGTGKKSLQSSPFIIPEIKAKQIVNGSCFSLVLSTSNEVFLFGSGGDGRTKNSKDLLTPTLLKEFSDKNIKQIAAGTDHILTLTSDGIIWGFGFGQHGTLGISELKTVVEPQLLQSPFTNSKFREIFCGMDISGAKIS